MAQRDLYKVFYGSAQGVKYFMWVDSHCMQQERRDDRLPGCSEKGKENRVQKLQRFRNYLSGVKS